MKTKKQKLNESIKNIIEQEQLMIKNDLLKSRSLNHDEEIAKQKEETRLLQESIDARLQKRWKEIDEQNKIN